MTDPGWHPDPFGRSDRRYHDGARWTEHVVDAAGTRAVDAPDPPPPTGPKGAAPSSDSGIVIGAPPPRRTPSAGAPAADAAAPGPAVEPSRPAPASRRSTPRPPAGDVEDAVPTGPAAAPRDRRTPPPASGRAPAPAGRRPPEPGAGADLAKPRPATPRPASRPRTPPPSPSPSDDATSVIPAEVAAEVARSARRAAPPAAADGGADRTTVIPAADAAAVAAAAGPGARGPGDRTGPIAGAPVADGPSAVPAPQGTPAPATGVDLIALVPALLGVVVGLVALFVLEWDAGAGASYLDLRTTVDRLGPPIGPLATSLVMSGGIFAVAGGGLLATARAIGHRSVSGLAFVALLLAFLGLSAAGFLAVDTDPADFGIAPAATPEGQEPGSPVTDPATGAPPTIEDGTPVTDPVTNAPPTVPDQGQGAEAVADETASVLDASVEEAERNLVGGAIIGFDAMFLATVLGGIGLLRRPAGSGLASVVALVLVVAWVVAGTVQLGADGAVPDLGPGPWVLAVATLLLTASTVLSARSRRAGR